MPAKRKQRLCSGGFAVLKSERKRSDIGNETFNVFIGMAVAVERRGCKHHRWQRWYTSIVQCQDTVEHQKFVAVDHKMRGFIF